jgi:hypothetical protein
LPIADTFRDQIRVKDRSLKPDFTLNGYTRQQKHLGPHGRAFDSDDGIEFVYCRICGDYRRVINTQHLSKHDTDRESYMAEYQLSPDQLVAKGFRILQSSRVGYYPNGKEEWVGAMKKVYEKDGKVFAGHLQDKYRHLYEQGIWIFGDWNKALRAAGFDPEKMRERRLWDEEKIIDTIRSMHKKHLPLHAKYAMDNHCKLFKAALHQFGSWAKALVAAGVTKKPRKTRLLKSKISLLNTLSDALEGHTVKKLPQAFKLEAAHYFGSLEKAIAKETKKTAPWLEQAKNRDCHFPDAPVQRESGLRESTTGGSGIGKRC